MEITTLLIASAILLIIYAIFRKPDPRLPPFPTRPLPFVGNILSMKEDYRVLFREWRQKCGDLFSLYMAEKLVVVLNGYDVINEALVKRADIFSDRPPILSDKATGLPGKGVIFASGKLWKEQRSVSLSILRAFGMGKNFLAEKIQEEVGCFIKYLSDLKGKPIDFRMMMNVSTSNIICSIMFGNRFEYDDRKFQDLIHKLALVVGQQQFIGLIQFVEWLKYIPGDFFKGKSIAANSRGVINSLATIVEDKKHAIEDSYDVSNFIDAYLIERNKKIQAGIPTTLDDDNLTKIITDLFTAGTETTSTTIYWCVLYMLNYPEVQEKVFCEIKDTVGTDRPPTIQDKNQLTYLNAVILETQRLASIVPLAVTHVCSEEVTLRGYTVPKGTWIIPNLDSVHHDKATWGEDALNFRPERFIDNNGALANSEQFMPFGTGRRVCLGESLAKMELFQFLSNMFQRFQFLPATPDNIPPLEYTAGAVIAPKPYLVRMVERK
ncbi:unnamed protein product [Candidula unifasciata]|uniref:Cytochrome P450 n=1 Tax=Candidula unifasciata TaxID=100452 RepID=A0A8S3YE24_9EUPU|nr:unnamed protein product [Candidula unifasciata]